MLGFSELTHNRTTASEVYMVARRTRAAVLAVGAVLLALATACTNPTAPAAAPAHSTIRADGGVTNGSSGHGATAEGVTNGSSG